MEEGGFCALSPAAFEGQVGKHTELPLLTSCQEGHGSGRAAGNLGGLRGMGRCRAKESAEDKLLSMSPACLPELIKRDCHLQFLSELFLP